MGRGTGGASVAEISSPDVGTMATSVDAVGGADATGRETDPKMEDPRSDRRGSEMAAGGLDGVGATVEPTAGDGAGRATRDGVDGAVGPAAGDSGTDAGGSDDSTRGAGSGALAGGRDKDGEGW